MDLRLICTRRRSLLLWGLAAWFATSGAVHADLSSDIQALVNQQATAHNVPGIVVGVWQGTSNIAMVQGSGHVAGSSPISSGDHYRIGSLTKSFTVTRLLQLASQGTVNLDDSIETYFPGTQNGSATLRQLANMTSGIFDYTSDAQFGQELFADLTATWTDAQLVEAAERNNPYFAPGGGWHYSNTATVLLGMVIEQRTGNTLASELATHVFSPAGLSQTSFPDSSTLTLPNPYAHGYYYDDGILTDMTQTNPSSSSGSGAMVSNMNDMRIWAKALATGTMVTPEMQVERLQLVSTAGGVGPEYDGYGLGIGSLSGWLGHTGGYFGYQNLVMYDASSDQTVIIYTNLFYNGHIPTDLFRDIVPLLAIPEPSLLGLIAAGAVLGGLAWRRRRL